jgi:hypothetical protein
MIFELIGTWLIAGFFSAIGWHEADQTVIKPYLTKEKPAETAKEPATPTIKELDNPENTK